MKLFYSGNSPYARRPRIAIREADLMDRVEGIVAAGEEREPMLFEYGPGAKVPGLLTDSGAYIRETLLIDIYLDCLLYTSPRPRDQRGSRMPSSA